MRNWQECKVVWKDEPTRVFYCPKCGFTDTLHPSLGLHQVHARCPNAAPGLGDRVAMGLTAFGITRERIAWAQRMFGRSASGCDGCDQRQEALNELGEKMGM